MSSQALSYNDFLCWASAYEVLELKGIKPNYRIFEDAYEKAQILCEPYFKYLSATKSAFLLKKQFFYNACLHYCIVTRQELTDSSGNIISQNPLYIKYDIANKSSMVSSASDEGSSASMLVTDAMQSGDFTMLDLARTPYGMYVYSILEQLAKMHPTLL